MPSRPIIYVIEGIFWVILGALVMGSLVGYFIGGNGGYALLAFCILLLVSFGIYLARRIRQVPTRTKWVIELFQVFYAVWEPETVHFLMPFMRIAAEVPWEQDRIFSLYPERGEDVAFRDGRQRVVVEVACRALDAHTIQYGVYGGAIANLRQVTGRLQNVFQTLARRFGVREATLGDIGGVLAVVREGEIDAKDADARPAIRDLWNWGWRVRTVTVRDVIESEALREAQDVRAKASYTAEADAETIRIAIIAQAAVRAKVGKPVAELTHEDFTAIKPYLEAATEEYYTRARIRAMGQAGLQITVTSEDFHRLVATGTLLHAMTEE